MMKYCGYAGSILRVDLTEEKIRKNPLNQDLIEKFIGGWGINLKLFHDFLRPNVDPFSLQNPIIIGAGPLVGTPVPGASKIVGTTKSPIVDERGKHFIDSAVAGGMFGSMLKKAGYDHLIVTGRADKPVYLKIIDEDVEICDSTQLWGEKDTYQTTDWLIDKHGGCSVISIGKAGENLVRYAMGIVDYFASLGRFGLGAVMGSKNLKAIVVKGTKRVEIAKPKEFLELTKEWRRDIEKIPIIEEWRTLGIASAWVVHSPLVREGVWEYSKWNDLYGPEKWLKIKKGRNLACYGCPMACRVSYEIKDGEFKGLTSFTGAYYLPARVGQRLEIENYREAIKLLDFCNRVGMCYFTASQIMNWVTRLYERGIISKRETGGLELSRKFDVYLDLFDKIAGRKGLGDLLADGWYPISKKVGADPDEFTEGTGIFKGADVIQDARFTRLHPQAFSNITNPRPHHGGAQSLYTVPGMSADLLKEEDAGKMGLSEEELKKIFTNPRHGKFNVARYAKHCEDRMAVYNCLGTCVVHTLWGFLGIKYLNLGLIAQIYSVATGIEVGVRELKKRGERVFNLFKLLNVREGFSGKDKCSKIWLTPRETPNGISALMDYHGEKRISKDDLDELLDDYYEERGWRPEDGIPEKKKLVELGLQGW